MFCRMFFRSYITVIIAVLLVPFQVCAHVAIVTQGKAEGTIFVPNDAPKSVRYAAAELREHLLQITGALLEITNHPRPDVVLAIGESPWSYRAGIDPASLPNDGFVITEYDGVLVIVGKDYSGPLLADRKGRTRDTYNRALGLNAHGETGTLFGVYRFLREVGVRWYMPGELGVVIPDMASIIYDNGRIEDKPEFTYRRLHGFSFSEDAEAAKWYKRIGYGSVRYININHNFNDWGKKYKKSNPEIFATIGGKPHTDSVKNIKRVVFNYTNNSFYQKVLNDAKQSFKNEPDDTIYPVVPNDSHVFHDESPATRDYITKKRYSRGWLSDLVWGFVNRIAKELYREYPEKRVASLAYAYQFDAPENIDRFSPNVVVMHCRNRLQTWDREYKSYIENELLEYLKLEPAENYVWEYYNLRATDDRLQYVPFIAPHLIQADIKRLKGVSSGEFIQAKQRKGSKKLLNSAFYHVNLYVTAAALWDPDIDVDALLTEYYSLFYGPASNEMRKFWTRLEDIWANQAGSSRLIEAMPPRERNKLRRSRWKYYWQEVYPPKVVKELMNNLEAAMEKTIKGTIYRRRMDSIIEQFGKMQDMSYRMNSVF